MPDFFAESITSGIASFSAEDSHHALRVLRLKDGESLKVSFEGRRYLSELQFAGDTMTAKVLAETKSTEPKTAITLYQGWAKGEKMEQIVRQATELGVKSIVPVLFSRCVAKPEGGKRFVRLNKIAREAAMQSGRTIIPRVEETIDVSQLRTRLEGHALALVAYEMERENKPHMVFRGETDIALVIGPEGGLTEREVQEMGASPLSLGPRILRTETAGIAAIAMLLALNHDFE